MTNVFTIVKAYYEAAGIADPNFKRWLKPAKTILARSDGSLVDALERIRDTKRWCEANDRSWNLFTVLKLWNKISEAQELDRHIDRGTESIAAILSRR